MDKTADAIRKEEGWSATVYHDSLGFYTLGYGFNVDKRGGGIPLEVADFWLQWKLDRIRAELPNRWPAFDIQPDEVKSALEQMAYQMGLDGLMKFKLMLLSLEHGNREAAAVNALGSKWAQQTPQRAERVASLLRGY